MKHPCRPPGVRTRTAGMFQTTSKMEPYRIFTIYNTPLSGTMQSFLEKRKPGKRAGGSGAKGKSTFSARFQRKLALKKLKSKTKEQ